ncbi:MAG: hypothetical protein ABIN91_18770 [Mucilaginibacter sp.]|uniref:hypothetical protein n=1 Tax=Mucilaginibacter sp. TaxID=1882438 RepID=UPI0032632D0B
MEAKSYNIQILSRKSEALLFQMLQQKCQLKKHFSIDQIEIFLPQVKNGLKFYGVKSTKDILQLNSKDLYQ